MSRWWVQSVFFALPSCPQLISHISVFLATLPGAVLDQKWKTSIILSALQLLGHAHTRSARCANAPLFGLPVPCWITLAVLLWTCHTKVFEQHKNHFFLIKLAVCIHIGCYHWTSLSHQFGFPVLMFMYVAVIPALFSKPRNEQSGLYWPFYNIISYLNANYLLISLHAW